MATLHKLSETEGLLALARERSRSLYFQADESISLAMVEDALKVCSPPGLRQISFLGFNRYEISGSDAWRKTMVESGKVWIGSRSFDLIDLSKDLDSRVSPIRVWIRVIGVPDGWRSLEGLKEIVFFGQIVGADPNTKFKRDLRWDRIEVQVGSRGLISETSWYEVKKIGVKPELFEVLFVAENEVGGCPAAEFFRAQPLTPWGPREEAFFPSSWPIPPFEATVTTTAQIVTVAKPILTGKPSAPTQAPV